MNASTKRILTFAVVLIATIAAVLIFTGDDQREDPVAVRAPAEKSKLPVASPLEMPEEMPEEATRARDYLKNRFDHLDEQPEVVAGSDPNGQRYFMLPDAIVGVDGQGNTIYAVGMARMMRFEGPTMKKKDRVQGSQLKVEGFDPSAGGLASRVKSRKIPLDKLPDSRFEKPPTGMGFPE